MRITNNMLSSQLLLNLNRNAQQMNNTQTQLATGRKINKPSDDPVGITYSLRYRAELSSNEQYQKNVDSAISWLEFNDTVMNQAGNVVQRLRELVVQGSTGTNPQSALDSINEEVKQLNEQLIDVSNSKLNGKYIFNGETYDVKPYEFPTNPDGSFDTSNAASIVTDKGKINFIVGESVQLPINVNGNEVFGTGTEEDNLFVTVNNIMKALTEGDTEALSKQLDNIDARMNKMLAIRSELGAKTNRVDLMMGRLDDLNINLTDLQAKVEDADYAELAMKSKIQENIYNASLSAGAKIISPSLVDFLR
ncbi:MULTISPECIES: flagellar hook-associated protein FlgL [unclassified Paenibacillus]|uniref:flagellar hook-associated protein FlgL n=1 Tax=unclassified Paenibacillus TaxID=185978 RepID=UPI000CFD9407|nr:MULTISPECIES: flagellar hook-associated protein FlgL [unclassified Paenibacillus]PRA03381.1 flagellar biosynthesis protein FlgL [Paenibacillus sp. MYb63]PRA46799.1 flagellar biosynthesis protein FlgL [Paenibacillus sp. MYb67]